MLKVYEAALHVSVNRQCDLGSLDCYSVGSVSFTVRLFMVSLLCPHRDKTTRLWNRKGHSGQLVQLPSPLWASLSLPVKQRCIRSDFQSRVHVMGTAEVS